MNDPDVITTFADRALREKLASTIPVGIGKLSVYTLLGYQALVGLDYRASDGFTLGDQRPGGRGSASSRPAKSGTSSGVMNPPWGGDFGCDTA